MDMQPNLTENIQYDIPVRSQTPSQAIPSNTRPVILTPKEKSITRIIVKKSSALALNNRKSQNLDFYNDKKMPVYLKNKVRNNNKMSVYGNSKGKKTVPIINELK